VKKWVLLFPFTAISAITPVHGDPEGFLGNETLKNRV